MKRKVVSSILAMLALLGIIGIVLFQVRGFEYVRLDDNSYTFDFAPVAAGFSWAGLKAVFSDFTQGGIWMPMTSLTYMLDISLFGVGPSVHHLASVVGHGLNAILFFCLLLRLSARWSDDNESFSRRTLICFFAALVWAVHPLRNESVAWIASRKDIVFTFFTLVGLLLWLRRSFVSTLLATICCALACLSKPTAMVFPFVAFLCEMLDSDKCDGSVSEVLRKIRWRRYVVPFVFAVATGLLATYSQTHATAPGLDTDTRGLYEGYGSLAWRCFNATVALGLYIGQSLIPFGAHIMYRPNIGGVPFGAVVGLTILTVTMLSLVIPIFIRRGKDKPWPLYWCALWFLVAIGPTLGIFGAFGDHARADRFLYLPAMGFSIALVWALCWLHVKTWLVAAILAPIALAYAVLTWENAKRFENDFTLFENVLENDPDHPLALAHVGAEFCARYNDPDDGIACFRRALELDPKQEDTAAQLSYALAVRGDPKDYAEIKTWCKNLILKPELDDKGMATEALGMVAIRERRWNDAIRFFTVSVNAEKRRESPDVALIQLAMCHYNKGDIAAAKKLFEQLARQSENRAVKQRALVALQRIWQMQGQKN